MEKQKLNLFRFVLPVLPVYIAVVFINLLFVGLDMLSPQISKSIVDDVLKNNNMEILPYLLGGILAIGVLRALLGYFRELSCDYAGSKIACNIRKDFFKRIQSLSANFFDRNNSGELMARVKDDVGNIWGLFTYIGMLLCEVVIHVILILVSMFRMNWKLAIIPAVSMFICAFVALIMEKHLGPLWGQIGEENQLLNNTAQENLNGVRTVKSFVREEFEINKFRERNFKYRSLNYKTSQVFVKYHPVLQVFRYLVPVAILLAGGIMYIRNPNEFTLGDLTAFIQYSMNIVWPMEMLGWLTSGLAQAGASIKRINKIYSETPQITEKDDAVSVSVKGDISYDHVSFSSENGKPVLSDVSFNIKAGQTLGIMGATGSGKTTIINLLKRMYDVTDGSILLDGINIKDMKLSELRRSISVVMQDVFLFSETINGNVRLGDKKTLSDSLVSCAMKDSVSDEFVSKLDEKEETVIGERGVGLSGGQKQRLTMARAMSRNAPVLVFDDSTSALDAETEKKIQNTLKTLNGMTKIIIAHRISSVKNADLIIVLDKGRIAESGTHDELLKKNGLYAETYATQYGSVLEESE
ncbi:MAG: ABC transporter ATP-binding protein [Treponema sp.]|nr:ABC transporter ATP-binding protein [Treponema sp.]